MRALLPLAAAVLLLAACAGADGAPATPSPATVALTVEDAEGRAVATLTAELAATPAERQRGLMFRQSLGEDEAMLFVFPAETRGAFWMKDTPIPLTIAFLAADGRVLELIDGRPFDETLLQPDAAYRHALEVNAGWFARRGLAEGARVVLPPGLPPGE